MRLLKASEITDIPHFTNNVLDAIEILGIKSFGTLDSEVEGGDYDAGFGGCNLPEYVDTYFTANENAIKNLSEEGKIFVDNQGNPLKITLSSDDLKKVINICEDYVENNQEVFEKEYFDNEDIDKEDDFAYAWLEDDDDEDDDDELLNEWFRKQEQKRR